MAKTKSVKEIVKEWLKDNGYDGLVHSWSECGCNIADDDTSEFMTCDQPDTTCESAYRREPTPEERSDGNEWMMSTEKQETKGETDGE